MNEKCEIPFMTLQMNRIAISNLKQYGKYDLAVCTV